jgi:acyl carrier protein
MYVCEVVVSWTFDVVADAIAATCHVPRDSISPDSNMVSDLGIDSLDLLDLGFALEDAFRVKLPLETWLRAVHVRTAAPEQYFVVCRLCEHIDALMVVAP